MVIIMFAITFTIGGCGDDGGNAEKYNNKQA
jgi:hypothetical protein